MDHLSLSRVRELLDRIGRLRVLVVGDVMLDQFIWGRVSRISPEAPVPVVEFEREQLMPGGAANVARNLIALGARASALGVVGLDREGRQLRSLLEAEGVRCGALLGSIRRITSQKVRVVAHRQQLVRVDRESHGEVDRPLTRRLVAALQTELAEVDAVIVGDYGKGVVTQALLDALRVEVRKRNLWLSLDPKPIHALNLEGLSLITPNRKEAFELAGLRDEGGQANPLEDRPLQRVAAELLTRFQPSLLLITLGEQGMLLCEPGKAPHHTPTVAREVFDVSGAGDTVIASFTLAMAAGASPVEAAVFSNHAAGVVVAKVGTAVVTPAELLASFSQMKGPAPTVRGKRTTDL